MKLSKLLWVLILVVLALPLNEQSPKADESEKKEPTKSSSASPPAKKPQLSPSKGMEKQNKGNRERGNANSPQEKPSNIPVTIEGAVTVINQPSTQEQAEQARKQAKNIWDKAIGDLIFTPSQWPNIGLMFLAGLAAVFALCAYLATRRQAIAAEQQLALATTPRLYVDGVRASDFESGKQPVFFVKIANAGPIAAEQVAINIRVEPDPHYIGAKYSDGVHIIMIPANGYREYFIKVSEVLTDNILDELNFRQLWQLRVTGYFEYGGKQTKYCYKYNPSGNPRPEGLPQFIPCDFNTQRTIIKMLSGSIDLSSSISGNLTVK